jgi:hypothetical protein
MLWSEKKKLGEYRLLDLASLPLTFITVAANPVFFAG